MPHQTLIKICGIKDASILACCVEAGADMLGFMHFAKSPRHLEIEKIAELIKLTPKNISSVVVLVDPDFELVKEISALKPGFIQLHGDETTGFIRDIISKLGQPVIKALPIGSKSDLKAVTLFAAVTSHILLDAKPPKNASRPGGLGQKFDWNLLAGRNHQYEFLLSGGLTPENVAEAIRQVRPMGIDISSGVESDPGIKDPAMIKEFIANVRKLDKTG